MYIGITYSRFNLKGLFTIKALKNYYNAKNELAIATQGLEILEERKKCLEKEIDGLNKSLSAMEYSLKKLNGIEYKLFYEIVVNNINVTRAIDKVADAEDKSPSLIWKKYYPKVKDLIETFQKS